MDPSTLARLQTENELVEINIFQDGSSSHGLSQSQNRGSGTFFEAEQRPPRSNRVALIETDFGDVFVTIEGELKKRVILTYHDIGLNHKVCFGPIFNQQSIAYVIDRFCIVHIDAPGHHADATPMEQVSTCESIIDLAKQLNQVVEKLNITSFIGFGAGAGGNVLLHYAISHRDKVIGLALIGTSGAEDSIIDRGLTTFGSYFQSFMGSTESSVDSLLGNYLSSDFREQQPAVVEYIKKETASIPLHAIQRFSRIYSERQNLLEYLRDFRFPVIMFVGEYAHDKDEQIETMSSFYPKFVSWIQVDGCASLPNIESPKTLIGPLRLWFNAF